MRRKDLVAHHCLGPLSTRVMDQLDVDGMSSDESEGDIDSRVYRINRLPWRSALLTQWLHGIDGLPPKNKNGATIPPPVMHRVRLESDMCSQGREPVYGLAQNLYSSDWIQSVDKETVQQLGMSNKRILLPVFTLAATED
jgi:hypothetical protein